MRSIGVQRRFLLVFALAVSAVMAAEWIVVHSIAFRQRPELIALAVTFDIVVVLPGLFYFLILRPRNTSPIFVVPVFLLSMVVAARILPPQHQSYLHSLRHLLPVLEVGLLAYVISRIPAFRRSYREERKNSIYFTDAFLSALRKTVGDRMIVGIVAIEFFLMLFAFAGWFLKWKEWRLQSFTYHRKAGYAAILGVLVFVTLMETVGMHIIISRWSIAAAWILTALSIYGILWLFGDFHAIRLHPIVLDNDTLHLRTGLRWSAEIPVSAIADVTFGAPQKRRSKSYLRASVMWPRAVIHFKEPVTVKGLFGIQRTVTQVGLSLDEPELFREAVMPAEGRT